MSASLTQADMSVDDVGRYFDVIFVDRRVGLCVSDADNVAILLAAVDCRFALLADNVGPCGAALREPISRLSRV